MSAEQYILQSDSQAAERLLIQRKIYEKSSQNLLLQSGLKTGMKVLEIGCGPGLVTPWLCKQVGEQGRIVAIDKDPFYIAQAHRNTSLYHNVEIKHNDVFEIDKLTECYDLIYCRMVLHHLQKPQFAFEKMTNCLVSKGILVCEEPPAHFGVLSYPESESLTRVGFN